MTEPVTGTCHCGMVHYSVPHKPKLLTDCNCSVCTKTGAIWAYYGPDDVIIMGATSGYARTDIPVATIEFHHCPKCGDRKSTRLNSSHVSQSRMPSSA